MESMVSVKTITEIQQENGTFLITCFSDKNSDGSTTPSIYKAQVLDKEKIIDSVSGKEGELMISLEDSASASLKDNGELVIAVTEDDVNRYERENENLIYNEE